MAVEMDFAAPREAASVERDELERLLRAQPLNELSAVSLVERKDEGE